MRGGGWRDGIMGEEECGREVGGGGRGQVGAGGNNKRKGGEGGKEREEGGCGEESGCGDNRRLIIG